ncbi:MAG: ABC transporter permease subunit, partial [Carnobacterium sp.]
QMEAGLSTGFTYSQTMRYIVLPQAVKIVIPPLGNQFINLVKNSSVLAMVAGLDLMYQGDLIASETFNTFETYILIGLLYLIITLPLTYLMAYIERRLASND